MEASQEILYTVDDIYSLPDGKRAELIDGQICGMAPPNFKHQKLVFQLGKAIGNYIDSHKGNCEVIPAPFAVFLNEDGYNYVEPDISVICDRKKLDDKGCHGAPDWIIEVASPGTSRRDYGIKLFKYRSAGVREYWIVNPINRNVMVFDLEHDEKTDQYHFDDEIFSCIYEDFHVCISGLL